MLMATTDGFTLATTSAIVGSAGALLATGGSVQLGLIGESVAVGVGDGLGDGDGVVVLGNNWQPTPKRRDKTTMRVIRYSTARLVTIQNYIT